MSIAATVRYPFPPASGLRLEHQYETLRECPVTRVRLPDGQEAWLVVSHPLVQQVLADRRFSRALACEPGRPQLTAQPLPGTSIVSMDPPQHTRLRALVARAFTPQRARELQPHTERLVDDLLSRMRQAGPPADIVTAVALPLPALVVGSMLGVPPEDYETFRAWTAALLSISNVTPEQADHSLSELISYVADLVAERRRTSHDDLIGHLVTAHDEHGALSDDELVGFGITLLAAGAETTTDQIANSVYALLRHPHDFRRLGRTPELVPSAVEELVRYVPLGSTSGLPRVATEDVMLGDVLIPRGDTVLPSIIAANGDPYAFPSPGTFDMTRHPNRHVGFGHGSHICLGAQVARMLLSVLLTALPRQFPDLKLACSEADIIWRHSQVTRGPVELPVTWASTDRQTPLPRK
ncbi:cytochrome P450 [Nonomuraea sp. NPDC049400]|uniref:cytochrome P450 n=1 Tax=Nonomuraea sp. NPDC049400 TaxID=3364352 RepID=UPI0037A6197A